MKLLQEFTSWFQASRAITWDNDETQTKDCLAIFIFRVARSKREHQRLGIQPPTYVIIRARLRVRWSKVQRTLAKKCYFVHSICAYHYFVINFTTNGNPRANRIASTRIVTIVTVLSQVGC